MDLADKTELIFATLEADDKEEFSRLLMCYPECRYDGGGDDLWMNASARRGKLWAVELLVNRGADVNKPSNSTDSVPAPEGPIVEAAGSGNVDLVRYMLDRGAQINFAVAGQIRCTALSRAAWKGHLDVVKLLLERGAELNSVWAEKTALDHAIQWGRQEVFDYLRSVGAKTAKELGY